MSLPSSWRRWLHLPSRIALLLGVGALSATGAEAGITEPHLSKDFVRVPQQSAKSFGELRIWSEEGRICFSEGDKDVQELRLADTPEARQLRQLLERAGADVASPRLLHNRIILVGGGGDGFHWAPAAKVDSVRNARVPAKTSTPSNEAGPGKIDRLGRAAVRSQTRTSEAEDGK